MNEGAGEPIPAGSGAHAAAGERRSAIAQALRGLDELDELPPREHVARFEALHAELTAALAEIDEV